jgi:D-sedoheptulose 7-phosphate isomerase
VEAAGALRRPFRRTDPMDADSAATIVHDALDESARIRREMRPMAPQVVRVAALLSGVFRAGGRVYACGNGGSACDAMHLVEELVARYKLDRPGLPAHHLLDPSTITCWSNDHDFASAFARQVTTLGRAGDALVALSTSGNSPNVLQAAAAARDAGMHVIGLTGGDGGGLATRCDECLRVPSDSTERVQEGHITLIHLLCELVERELFPSVATASTSPS